MTREEEIKKAAFEYADKELIGIIDFKKETAFIEGAMWADGHPHWISVKEEPPKTNWTMSDTVVVTDGNGGFRLAWYHQDEGWHFATGLTFEPTHWMPLPPPPKKGE